MKKRPGISRPFSRDSVEQIELAPQLYPHIGPLVKPFKHNHTKNKSPKLIQYFWERFSMNVVNNDPCLFNLMNTSLDAAHTLSNQPADFFAVIYGMQCIHYLVKKVIYGGGHGSP